ncbi:hypothetical protein K3495_g6750 [Podosphaera aphanis]|nr:hypothetical protein K3495_g6750 [Podosphaera aphanis]
MEDSANRGRQEEELLQEGDNVWLNLKNIATPRPSKKHSPSFPCRSIKRAAEDPLPSQKRDDYQSSSVDANIPRSEQEYGVDRILKAERRRRGRGFRKVLLVKWRGQAEPTWEPRSKLENTVALVLFEQKYGTGDNGGEVNIGMYTGVRRSNSEGGCVAG